MNTIGPYPLRRNFSSASRRSRNSIAGALCAFLLLTAAPVNQTTAFSIIDISRDTNQFITITWESSTNFVFIVLSSDDPGTNAVWAPRAAMSGLDGATGWTDATTTNVDHGFFRVARVDPMDDFDGDGMPNGWELRYGLNPIDPGDAHACIVCDGTDNLTKYLQGRDPTKEAVADTDGHVSLSVFTPLE
jgi:hypothetical protein